MRLDANCRSELLERQMPTLLGLHYLGDYCHKFYEHARVLGCGLAPVHWHELKATSMIMQSGEYACAKFQTPNVVSFSAATYHGCGLPANQGLSHPWYPRLPQLLLQGQVSLGPGTLNPKAGNQLTMVQ